MAEIEAIFSRLNSESENFNPNIVADKIGIKLETKPAKISAKQLTLPELQLGKKERIEEHRSTSFSLFNKQLFNCSVALRIGVLMPNTFDFSQAKDLLRTTCANLGLEHKVSTFLLKFQDSKGILKNIEEIVMRECSSAKEAPNIFWVLLPNNFKTSYSAIKKIMLRCGIEKNSQVSLVSTLQGKNFASILTKILLQMAAKVGNKPWVPKVSSKLGGSGVMLVGIESCRDTTSSGMKVLSYCSSCNK